MKIEVRSRNTVNQKNGSEGTVAIISIADPNDEHPHIYKREGLQEVLQLSFHDLDNNHRLPEKYKIMSKEDGTKVAEFVKKHGNVDTLIVQCDAGISRSSGMAAAILKFRTGDDSQIFEDPFFIPNKWVNKKTLEGFYRLDKMTEAEMDELYDKIDDLMLEGKFDVVNEMFIWENKINWVLTMLTATLPAKSKFSKRRKFYEQAEKWYGKEMVVGLG